MLLKDTYLYVKTICVIFIKKYYLDGIGELFKKFLLKIIVKWRISIWFFFIVCKSLSSTWKAPAMPNLLQTLNFAPASMPTLHLGQKCTGSSVKCRPALQKRFLLHMHVLRLHRPICNTWKRKYTYPAKSVIYKSNQKA